MSDQSAVAERGGWVVVDNVTGRTSEAFDKEESAEWLCRALNIQAGPGGRYAVRVS